MSIPVSRNIALALAMLTLGGRASDSDHDSGRAADTAASTQPPAPEAAPPAAQLTSTTLDFQGKIDDPISVDTAHANPELGARLTSDPFPELTPQSASALRAHSDRLTPVWIEYVDAHRGRWLTSGRWRPPPRHGSSQ